jgi:cytochrome c biogenesis protein
MRLRAALQDPELRQRRRALCGAGHAAAGRGSLARPVAGVGGEEPGHLCRRGQEGGFLAISRFLEKIPAAEQEKAADIFMKILNGSLWDLWQAARARMA